MGDSYQHVPQDPDESYDRPSDYPDDDSLADASANGFNYREYRRPADSFKGKVQQKYWKGKQTMLEKLGKQQDEFVVAGDAEVDARLEAFRQIQKTCIDLLRAVEVYQKKIFALSQEENESGRFLREKGSVDKTKAGKMMISVGKALSYTAQQRLTLRVPLVRLYQEVETFRHRAIGDTWETVNRMERLRSEYRAALLWMADISKELDPEAYRKLDKYREVQSEVKVTKKKFDKCKVDVIQKVDLLSASRCNLLSATLVAYQQSLLKFWENSSGSLTKVYEQFRGHPSYQFQMLKHIIPDDSYTRENDVDDDEGDEGVERIKEERIAEAVHVDEKDENSQKVDEEGLDVRERSNEDDDALISLDNLPDRMPPAVSSEKDQNTDLLGGSPAKTEETTSAMLEPSSSAVIQGIDDLLGLSGGNTEDDELNIADFMLNNTSPEMTNLGAATSAGDSINNGLPGGQQNSDQDLLGADNSLQSTDDLLFGNLSQPENPTTDNSFTETWNKMFGNEQQQVEAPSSQENLGSPTKFMPSDLIDSFASLDPYAPSSGFTLPPQATGGLEPTNMQGPTPPLAPAAGQPSSGMMRQNTAKPSDGNLSTWLNLFSDLDPLSNPDAIGQENQENDAKRSC
ncbi:islet cell autoantigen 1-like [Dendronephthya gigantea]|uniref:islet cell autoantigen 1-like n=1 Tax=Dendronephthya gigantea TaxID=151771 RepID=UPI00106A134C|nr:islet cell autoantigen 1-like [Dendronephthya gigantea]XP_028408937.1 islet cell autoantigen 1-like [Dendronephthya gigantea]